MFFFLFNSFAPREIKSCFKSEVIGLLFYDDYILYIAFLIPCQTITTPGKFYETRQIDFLSKIRLHILTVVPFSSYFYLFYFVESTIDWVGGGGRQLPAIAMMLIIEIQAFDKTKLYSFIYFSNNR